jgi:hypothetical protein
MREFLISLWLRLRALVLLHRMERDLDDELSFHLEMRQAKLEQARLSQAHASFAARRRLGNPCMVQELDPAENTKILSDGFEGAMPALRGVSL